VSRLDSYVGKTVLAVTLLAWVLVAALEAVFVLLGELGDIGRADYALPDALLFVLLTVPGRAYQSFAVAALIGSLLGVGGLAAKGELNAFRLAGCSPLRLARAVMQAGALMVLVAVLIGEGWAPVTQQLARQMRAAALVDEAGIQQGAGFWLRDGARLIQVGQSEPDGSLTAVRVFELDTAARLVSATAVARARFKDEHWIVEDIRETRFTGAAIELRVVEQAVWAQLMDPRLANLLTRDAQTLSLGELGRYIAYLQHSGSSAQDYQLSYWQRLAAPLSALAMLLLSVSLVLGRLGSQGAGQRVLIGVLIGLAFKLGNEIFAHAGLVYGMAPWLSAVLPSVLVLIAGSWLLHRAGPLAGRKLGG
jgi:lipopolysaccharide export system permease protein